MRYHSLFFGIKPDPETAILLESLVAGQPALRAAGGKTYRRDRFHITLCVPGSDSMSVEQIIAVAKSAASRVDADEFDLILDESAVYSRAREKNLVLRCSTLPEGLVALRAALRAQLILAGAGSRIGNSFTPHLTLVYGAARAVEPVLAAPIRCRISGFQLLASVGSAAPHEVLGSWPLRDRSAD